MYTLITGASSGIGKATAETLAAKGHDLILIARSTAKLERLQQMFMARHEIDVKFFTVDVTDPAVVEDFFAQIQDLKIGNVINNAGGCLGKDKFQDALLEDLFTMIDANIRGFTHIAHRGVQRLIETQGTLVNISSIAGIEPYPQGHVYCATKAFVKTISKTLRFDLMGTGVRVIDIAPAAVNTNFSKVRFKGDVQKADAVYAGYQELSADDIATQIVWALEQPPHVNLEHIVIYPTAQAGPRDYARE